MNVGVLLATTLAIVTAAGRAPGEEGQMKKEDLSVRPPVVAGTFYSASADGLRRQIEGLLAKVPDIRPEGRICALVAPHAGYVFSGQVAAYSYKLLSSNEFDTAVIIGHNAYRNAVAYVCRAAAYETPLGKVPVDLEMIDKLMAFHPGIREDALTHAREHSVEVQLPFLQVLGKKCMIVPVLFGNPTLENCRIMADAITNAAGSKRVLVVASTDMCHYPPYDVARKVDNATLDALKLMDAGKLFAHLQKEEAAGRSSNIETAMCGSGGVGTAILFARSRGADRAQILRYANSGDVAAGDKDRVVGYSAAVLVQSEGK
jgi:MEMO1 family protein